MVRCFPCLYNVCGTRYMDKSINTCKGFEEGIKCTCLCQVSRAKHISTSAISIGTGVVMAAGGVALAVTGGPPGVICGAAMVGAGTSLVMTPIQKTISGEHMTLKDSAADVALGATIGAITGPIGSGASTIAKGASSVVKFGVRAGAGAAAGAVSGAAGEAMQYLQGEEVTQESVARTIGIGLLAGSVGGASTHLGSNLSKGVASGVAKAATQVSVQAASAAATDASLQFYDHGEINFKQLTLNTAGQAAVGSTAEASQNIMKRTSHHCNHRNKQLINENVGKKGGTISKAELMESFKEINSLPKEDLKANVKQATEYTEARQKVNELIEIKKDFQRISKDHSLSENQKAAKQDALSQQKNLRLVKTQKYITNEIKKAERAVPPKPDLIGEKNIHALTGERVGQIAVDLEPTNQETGVRSNKRAVFEMHSDKVFFTDHTDNHDYKSLRKDVQNFIPNEFDALRPENINQVESTRKVHKNPVESDEKAD